jgi:hypothetical protein
VIGLRGRAGALAPTVGASVVVSDSKSAEQLDRKRRIFPA